MKRTIEQLQEELENAKRSYFDGKCRIVDSVSHVMPDGETWGIVNDHGNVELVHKGKNGHIYYHGGLV